MFQFLAALFLGYKVQDYICGNKNNNSGQEDRTITPVDVKDFSVRQNKKNSKWGIIFDDDLSKL